MELRPRLGQAIKPAELIQITGHQQLTLNARRAITILWHNAHMQGVEEGRDYRIEIDDLKTDGHKLRDGRGGDPGAGAHDSSRCVCRAARPGGCSSWAAMV